MTHNIKLLEEFCDAVDRGDKSFEVRKNDRNYKVGDIVRFLPIAKDSYPVAHPVQNKTFRITCVLSGWGIKEGFVAFGIKEITERRECDE